MFVPSVMTKLLFNINHIFKELQMSIVIVKVEVVLRIGMLD